MISDEKLEQIALKIGVEETSGFPGNEFHRVALKTCAIRAAKAGFRAAESMSEARIAELELAVREMAVALAQFDEYCPVFEPTGCCSGMDCGCYGKPINPEYYLNGLARTTLEKHRALIEALKVQDGG
jgi:hypothetical protein